MWYNSLVVTRQNVPITSIPLGENCALAANQSISSAKVWNRGFNWPVFGVGMHKKSPNVLNSNGILEKILTSAFHWLAQKRCYWKPPSFKFVFHWSTTNIRGEKSVLDWWLKGIVSYQFLILSPEKLKQTKHFPLRHWPRVVIDNEFCNYKW